MKIRQINTGEEIKAVLEQRGRSIAWLARQIGCDPHNLCKILSRHSMDTDRLRQISNVLDYQFFSLFCEAEHDVKNMR